ncbi:1-deoxy-D-xylulose-5-phosphate synthase [Faecalibacter macacae]|uniref:1-deoxy-D-xylulose-5-phosphate synthase n=1 Tax=Faecalibacter macacae TaxID=1859289 RepID=A0A3L9MCJ1_9FLAO|nr:1-deoxy-D-xylulose-5-phosphate synthase [Faecalibacter macacae]RLZ10442.1 1-deoxy-D-xylulose-5-phosphate synthase [Faecalibacter macacae]
MNKAIHKINHPKQLRELNQADLPDLAKDLREYILDTLSVKPGHLGASLGVIELTIALHYHFDTPTDLLIWDVGHQCYPHKLLTGRRDNFDTLRQENGISGFPSREESEFDVFGTGHSSTSISAIVGMATADEINGINRKHIAVIGDASITSGMSLEALNHLGSTDLDVLVILNNNSIGIDPSVGGLKQHFNQLTNNQHSIFEDFGLNFLGTVDGHNFDSLLNAFQQANETKGPKVLHVKTVKGKGYEKAELDQVKWHAPGLFDKETGKITKVSKSKSYQDVFGETMLDLLNQNEKIIAITPAMITGSNLVKCHENFPKRVIDVGIAEQHAVTFAAGLAAQNTIPYCTIYSTFLQRAYDQVIHDVALQNLPVVFCIDRAGIVGSDGATHHGYFDISYLNTIPNVIIASPSNEKDFKNILYTAQFTEQPFAVRFPKESIETNENTFEYQKITIGKANKITEGNKIALLATGQLSYTIKEIITENKLENEVCLIDFPFIKPLDEQFIKILALKYNVIATFEDGILNGGFGDSVLKILNKSNYKGSFKMNGYPDEFITHGTINQLNQQLGLDKESILKFIQSYL